MADIVVFGIKDTAELANYYLEHDSEHNVIAFCAHDQYIEAQEFCGKPLIPQSKLTQLYPPSKVQLFAPMTHQGMNKPRAQVYSEGKELGYAFISYVSSKASVHHNEIGENCFILEDNTLQPFTKIGNNVVLWSGNHIGHHGEIKDHVFFTSHVVMSGHCLIESYCFCGVNATIRDASHLSEGTLLAMGSSLVAQQTEAWSVYVGNPAKRLSGKRSDEVT